MVQQGSLTIITPVPRDRVDELNLVLDAIGRDVAKNGRILNLPAITTIHLCSFTLINDDPSFEPSLAFECNHDGPPEACLADLIRHGREGLLAIYKFCAGFSPDRLEDYLLDHRVKTAAFYVGCRGQSVGDIRNAFGVRQAVQAFVDQHQTELANLSARDVHRRIKRFLVEESPVKPLTSACTLDAQTRKAWTVTSLLVLAVLAAIVFLPVLVGLPWWVGPLVVVGLLGGYFFFLRLREKADDVPLVPANLPIDRRIFGHEDVFVMNHMTTMVNVRPGKFRLGTLKVVLWLIDLLARIFFTRGELGGIPTIHFARWLFTDHDRRLLFYSNYDGSWASYLGDFVDKANFGLTAVWSNTDRFPPSKWLFFEGAMHIEAFKAWSREHNLYTAVWYSAYGQETLWNLRKDVRFRDTVGHDLSEANAAKLLRLL